MAPRKRFAVLALVAYAFLIFLSSNGSAQPATTAVEAARAKIVNDLAERIAAAARVPVPAGVPTPTYYQNELSVNGTFPSRLAMWLLLNEEGNRNPFLQYLQEQRVDQQVGSTGDTGTTTLVSKGGAPAILGLALEHGGFQRTVSGTSVTFRGNPVGLIESLQNKGLLEIHDDLNRFKNRATLNRFSFAVSLDTQNAQGSSLTAGRQSVSSWSWRAEIVNHRDPRDRRYDAAWAGFIRNEGNRFLNSWSRFRNVLNSETWPEFNVWYETILMPLARRYDARGISAPVLAEFLQELRQALDQLDRIPLPQDPQFRPLLASFGQDLTALFKGRDEVLEIAQAGSILTLEHNVSRDPQLPDLSRIQLIGEASIGGRIDLTANASSSFFHSRGGLPVNVRMWRDLRFSGQVDVLLGEVASYGRFVLTMAGRWEHIPKDTLTPGDATVAPTLKGNIGVFQAKLTIPMNSGLKIPIAFTASNRSELIPDKKDVRAHVGITFDLDSLLSGPK